jgi:hypothetical protein
VLSFNPLDSPPTVDGDMWYDGTSFLVQLGGQIYALSTTTAPPPSLPSGAIGVWYADTYSSSSGTIPNSASGVSTTPYNLFRASRRLFNNVTFWSGAGTTIVDNAAVGPDGSNDASTLVGTGAWYQNYRYGGSDVITSGTYTAAIWAKSNTGSNQQFSFSATNTATVSSPQTATSTWQRFTYTFNVPSSVSTVSISICSINGATGANLQICDFHLFSGSVDLVPTAGPPSGHLYLGGSMFNLPNYSSGAVDLSTGASNAAGLIQLPTPASPFTSITTLMFTSQIAAGSGYQALLSDIGSYTSFTAAMDISKSVSGLAASTVGSAGFFSRLNQGYHMYAHRTNSVTEEVFLDNIKIYSGPLSFSSQAKDLAVGYVNDRSLYCGDKFSSIVMYNRALSDSEISHAYSVLKARAATSGITAANARIYCAEGDSVTGGFSYCYPFLYLPNASPKIFGRVSAVSGSTISDANGRAAYVDSIIPANKAGRKFILSVLLGANDGPGADPTTWAASMATYLDARRAAGWIVLLCTVLPKTASGMDTWRATVNGIFRSWTAGQHWDHLVDFAADPVMGPDAAASDTTLYADGTHPTSAGQSNLEAIIRPILNSI